MTEPSARRFGGPCGYGHLPDPADHQVTPIQRHFAKIGANGPLPSKVDFRSSVTILDQSITSSCVGHAIVGAIQTRFQEAGKPLERLSPLSVYDFARLIDEPGIPMVDQGSNPNAAFRGITEWGIARYDARPTDPGAINDVPKLGELESAAGFEFDGYYGINGLQSSRADLLCRALAAGVPATLALQVDDAFEQYAGGLYMPGGRPLGGHYVFSAGYDTLRSNGSKIFFVASSWTTSWGEGGFAEMPEACVPFWSDIYGIAVSRI